MGLPTTYSWTLSITDTGGKSSPQAGLAGNRTSGQGKTGIAIPFSADGRGRIALVSGDDQLQKIIAMNLSDCQSDNPFQDDLGIGADMVFAIASTKLRADLKRRITVLFRRLQLQDRARLAAAPTFEIDDKQQELNVDINYVNIEEDKPGNLGMKFSLASAVG